MSRQFDDEQQSLSSVSRRRFLKSTGILATACAGISGHLSLAEATREPWIDTNVHLGQWPFRRLELVGTQQLVTRLTEKGITQAWVSHFDLLLHKDLSRVNSRLSDECRQHGNGMLLPVGAINAALPGWEDDLRTCANVYKMHGIRLYPNYHGYKLSDPVFSRVLTLAGEHKLFVQIVVVLEDDRTLHPLVNVPPTDISPLAEVLKSFPDVKVQLLNGLRNPRGEAITKLAALGVRFEIAMLEGVLGVSQLLDRLPLDCVCFGSHAPFYYLESAILKLQESDLPDIQRKGICSKSAGWLLSQS